MLEANVTIIKELKKFVITVGTQPSLLQYFTRSDTCFTRNRKLPFEKLILLITRLCKKTLSLELEDFFEEMNLDSPCSVSGFSQQRNKLEASFFYCWNMVLWFNFYLHYDKAVKRWKEYRVIACDGSTISLVNNEPLSRHFGGQTNQHSGFILGKTFYCYDVLNGMILFPQLGPYRYGELDMAYDNMEHLESDMLMIYDRNFANYKMIALHQWQEKEIKFIIRAKESQRMIKAFIKSKKKSAVVIMEPTPSAIKGLQKSGYKINRDTILKVRLVRVELEKSIEVLMTNLWEEEGHPVKEFKNLYFMRWGIETNIGFQKNVLQLESFSGLTVKAVLQDFYATVFIANLHSLLIKDAQETVDSIPKQYKYPMKINSNKSLGRLKRKLTVLFATNDTNEILRCLHDLFIRDIVPIRKGRSCPHTRKNVKSKSKHRTFTNFKPSY